MALKIKSKVAFGVVFLFFLLTLVGSVSYFYFNKFTTGAKTILQDNYETLGYTYNMLQALDIWKTNSSKAKQQFEKNLSNQEGNITEPGEYNATRRLREDYNNFLKHEDSLQLITPLRDGISNI